jgi:AcrR family transcriptional regulator
MKDKFGKDKTGRGETGADESGTIRKSGNSGGNVARRGDETRRALIQAGLELFGEYGIKGTSTRMLAELSGANVAAIPYHFGSKQGLYLSVVGHIVEAISVAIGDVLRDLETEIAAGPLGRERALAGCQRIFRALAELMVESDEPKAWARVLLREQFHPTEGFDLFYDRHIRRVQRILTRLAGACTGLDPESDEVKIRVHALIGQLLGFLVNRESLLRALGTARLTKSHTESIHRVLAAHVAGCLGRSIPGK